MRQGSPVPLAFTVANAGKGPVTLPLAGREPTADFTVTEPSGRAVWSHLRGKILRGSLRLFPLDAGKKLSFKQVWDQRNDAGQRVRPGEYLVRAVLLTDDPEGLASRVTHLRIEP